MDMFYFIIQLFITFIIHKFINKIILSWVGFYIFQPKPYSPKQIQLFPASTCSSLAIWQSEEEFA